MISIILICIYVGHIYYMRFAEDIFFLLAQTKILIQCDAKYCKSSTYHNVCNFTLASCSHVRQRYAKRKIKLNFKKHSLKNHCYSDVL